VDQIGRGAQQQASATQEAGAALGQIEKMAGQVRDNAKKSLDAAYQIEKMLSETTVTVARLSDGVVRATEATTQSLQMVAGLEAISRKVDKIVDSIGMVSIQTNLLAVNGSVEAARAGDFGKGFAVVSKDIRNLARDAGENAERAKDTVRTIQDNIAVIRRELELTIAVAEAENQKSEGVRKSLGSVKTEMGDIAGSNQEILTSAETIMISVTEAHRGAQQIAAAAEQAGSATTESAAAAKQQARAAEDLAAAIEEIASLADEMQKRNG
jgi:methyl-accepting chemotaxis protein